MASESSDNEEDYPGRSKLTNAERKALMATTQVTELQMVELWNQFKFNFPTGKANDKQLKQLIRKVNNLSFFVERNSSSFLIDVSYRDM